MNKHNAANKIAAVSVIALPKRPPLPSHVEPCSLEFVEWALSMERIAAKYTDELQWLSEEAMESTPVGTKLYAAPVALPAQQGADQECLSLIADLAAVVRVQNGNLHKGINAMLARADRILSAQPQVAHDTLAEMERRKDGAYYERNQVVAALAKCFPSGVAKTAIEGWSEDWHGCVYIDLPTGQVSWHFHDSHAHLFAGLPQYSGKWDGHTTEEKYARLAALSRRNAVEQGERETAWLARALKQEEKA